VHLYIHSYTNVDDCVTHVRDCLCTYADDFVCTYANDFVLRYHVYIHINRYIL